MTSKLEWYRAAITNLGLPSLLRLQMQKHSKAELHKLTSKALLYPVFARDGTSDHMVFDQIFVESEYRCLDGLKDPQLILDCGANVGYSSAYFLSRFPKSFVVAVEPDASNFSILQKNLAPYRNRYRAVKAAVWPQADKLAFNKSTLGVGQEWGRQVEKAPSAELDSIEAVTIPMLMWMTCFDRISILKIDIEGAEYELFTSKSIEWLTLADNIIIELHGQACHDAFFKAIDAKRFDTSSCGELTVCLGKNQL